MTNGCEIGIGKKFFFIDFWIIWWIFLSINSYKYSLSLNFLTIIFFKFSIKFRAFQWVIIHHFPNYPHSTIKKIPKTWNQPYLLGQIKNKLTTFKWVIATDPKVLKRKREERENPIISINWIAFASGVVLSAGMRVLVGIRSN